MFCFHCNASESMILNIRFHHITLDQTWIAYNMKSGFEQFFFLQNPLRHCQRSRKLLWNIIPIYVSMIEWFFSVLCCIRILTIKASHCSKILRLFDTNPILLSVDIGVLLTESRLKWWFHFYQILLLMNLFYYLKSLFERKKKKF